MSKSPEIVVILDKLSTAIFGSSRSEALVTATCVICKEEAKGFTSALSVREYEISGMCQTCQDKVFE